MVSMTNYLTKEIQKFQQPTPKRFQYAPHKWTCLNFAAIKLLATPLDNSPPIPEERKRRIQKVVGTFLYYYQAVYCTMLPDLNIITEQHSNLTKNTEAAITQFIDYSATNPSAIIQI